MKDNIQIYQGRQYRDENEMNCFVMGNEFIAVSIVESSCTSIIHVYRKERDHDHETTSCPRILIGHQERIMCMQFYSRDDHDLLLCSVSQNNIYLWKITTSDGEDEFEFNRHELEQPDNHNAMSSIAFDATGSLVAFGTETNVFVLQSCSGHVFAILDHTSRNISVAFHPLQTHLLVSTYEDKTFRVYDLAEKTILYTSAILSVMSPIISMSLHPENGRIYLGFSNGKIQIFSIQENGYCRAHTTVLDMEKYLASQRKISVCK